MTALIESKLDVNQYSDFYKGWVYEQEFDNGARIPRDLTGWTAKMQIRRSEKASLVLLEVTEVDDNGNIIVLDDEGNVDLFISDTATGAFDFTEARYDLILIQPDGRKIRFAEGPVVVDLGVTQ